MITVRADWPTSFRTWQLDHAERQCDMARWIWLLHRWRQIAAAIHRAALLASLTRAQALAVALTASFQRMADALGNAVAPMLRLAEQLSMEGPTR